MPLHQLCASSGTKRNSSSTTPYVLPPIHAQEVYNMKFPQRPLERCSSQTSTLSFSRDICRICHCEGDEDSPLIAPCYCSGSLRYVHQTCLQQWIKSSDTKCCELCTFAFIMHSKVKPFNKWERLDMSGVERRKILCSVTFHAIAITCVVWSLYVLIQRTSQEVQSGDLEWPFWTKLIVVAIGFTGSIVFMYVQCKMYIHLCRRWRAFNRVIYVQNAPEKMKLGETEKEKIQKDAKKKQSTVQMDVEKPFLGVAVITSNVPQHTSSISNVQTTHLNTSSGGCCTTSSSSPPGALWVEEEPVSPQLSKYSYFNTGSSDHQRRTVEMETLIHSSETQSPSASEENAINSKIGLIAKQETSKSSVPTNSKRIARLRKEEEEEEEEEEKEEEEEPDMTRRMLEPRIVHKMHSSYRMQSESGSESSDVETLHLNGP